jgi:signal peptidase
MTDFSGDPLAGATSSSQHDTDRDWWGEPDPVDLFASGFELALRQLRVEVASLRAERDGLRLELEGLRAKLVIAQDQLAARDGLADTVRQLHAAVARLTMDQARAAAARAPMPEPVSQPAPLVPRSESIFLGDALRAPRSEPTFLADAPLVPSAPSPIAAAPPVEPVLVEPVVVEPVPVEPVVVEPEPVEPLASSAPAEPAVVEPEPAAPAAPGEPSAIEQLRARGLWPPSPTGAPQPEPNRAAPTSTPAPAPIDERFAAPHSDPEPESDSDSEWDREPAPYQRATPTRESVVTWDRMSTRRTPVVVEDAQRERLDPAVAPAAPRSLARKIATVALGGLGALVVVTILLVSVGPRVLPYQTYFVRSGSMEPTIGTGSMVVLTKVDGAQLQPGDIITFKNPDNESVLVTHRIVEIETTDQGRVFVTKGDANADVDTWRVPASGTGWRYKFNIPVIGYIFGYLGTPQARLGLLVIPAAILGLLALLDIWRPKPDER